MAKTAKIGLKNLRNDESYSFHKAVSELASQIKYDGAKPFSEAYGEAFSALREAIDQEAGQSAAARAQEADGARDVAWQGANAYIKAMGMYHPVVETRRAAEKIMSLFEKYGNPTKLSLAEETSVLENLVESIERQAADEVETCIFGVWVSNIKERQAEFAMASKISVEEKADRIVGKVKNARTSCDDAFASVCSYANAMSKIAGSEGFDDFISRVNVIIERQRQTTRARMKSATGA